jgi:hypothetical protein
MKKRTVISSARRRVRLEEFGLYPVGWQRGVLFSGGALIMNWLALGSLRCQN